MITNYMMAQCQRQQQDLVAIYAASLHFAVRRLSAAVLLTHRLILQSSDSTLQAAIWSDMPIVCNSVNPSFWQHRWVASSCHNCVRIYYLISLTREASVHSFCELSVHMELNWLLLDGLDGGLCSLKLPA
eukprot:TRINITY_DN29046_c0_g1_i1.p2 TRINITY_DN29046_c0_g1~~TRINITY_DN29046_c0_g1_i1.p2  ORF type:complete len:130 (+),score=2.82 TRINITY_DN29046_c0_g1_i1:130-519(+)